MIIIMIKSLIPSHVYTQLTSIPVSSASVFLLARSSGVRTIQLNSFGLMTPESFIPITRSCKIDWQPSPV